MPHSVTNDSSATMSRPSSTSTGSANAFPRAAGATLLAPEQRQDQLSPSRSTFSFDSSPSHIQPASERVTFEDVRPSVSRGTEKKSTKPVGGARRRAAYYEEQFAYKDDSTSSARERVIKDAPVVADLRTNVIIKDEYTLVTDLSHHLSQRYQRPESSIMITVNHSACLLLGGSFEPTYVLTISALPVQLQPTTNKRNAALIQQFMFESIGVSSERGIIKFMPIQEDCLATNGSTVLGEIEKLERQQADDNGGNLKRALTKSSKASKASRRSVMGKAKSSIQLSRNVVTPPIPSPGPFDSGVDVNEKEEDQLTELRPVDSVMPKASMKHTPSPQLNEKAQIKATTPGLLAPPSALDNGGAPRLGKRKSFMTIFRR